MQHFGKRTLSRAIQACKSYYSESIYNNDLNHIVYFTIFTESSVSCTEGHNVNQKGGILKSRKKDKIIPPLKSLSGEGKQYGAQSM